MAADDESLPADDPLYEGAACGLVLTDRNGLILRANRTFCIWLGYGHHELVERLRIQDLLTVGGRIFHQTHWAPLLRMQGSIAEVKLELTHQDGRVLPVVLNAVSREHGGVICHELAVFVAEDRHRYERELMVARKRAEELLANHLEAQQALALADARLRIAAEDRARFAEQMMGIVSHDLRTPLTAIKMGVQLLGTPTLTASQRERAAGHAEKSAARAQRLVEDLLDFTQARLGAGLKIIRRPVDLHGLVDDAIGELRVAFPERILEHTRHGEGPCAADADRLIQLLGNLVANAMAYGIVDGTVTVTSSIDANGFAIEVHNGGTPIPASLLPGLFEPMTRGAKSGGESRSVGLGLFIVQEIARAHAGHVRVSSSSEGGTTFRAIFPRA